MIHTFVIWIVFPYPLRPLIYAIAWSCLHGSELEAPYFDCGPSTHRKRLQIHPVESQRGARSQGKASSTPDGDHWVLRASSECLGQSAAGQCATRTPYEGILDTKSRVISGVPTPHTATAHVSYTCIE